MKTVCLAIPPVDDLYPWKAARAGLEKIGLRVIMGGDGVLDADLLVTWSPWNGSRRQGMQLHYSRAQRPVIVMENGWLSPLGVAHSRYKPTNFYQVALNGWNGTGRFQADGPSRWRSWRVPEMPWVDRPNFPILIIGQRGHPSDERTAPPDWHMSVRIAGDANIFRRARVCDRPLEKDLGMAREVHVWSSNAASHAVMSGVPVVQHGPNLMVGAMASRPGRPLYRGDRGLELERLAWAQWSADEILTGEPFARLLVAA